MKRWSPPTKEVAMLILGTMATAMRQSGRKPEYIAAYEWIKSVCGSLT